MDIGVTNEQKQLEQHKQIQLLPSVKLLLRDFEVYL
jgi:hypothetical protein